LSNEETSTFGSFPPPRDTDILFADSHEDWQLNACIEHWGDVDRAYIIGFRSAAFQLTNSMCQNPTDQDSVVYPILYLYRHHIEMQLKSIIRLAMEILGEEVSNKLRKKLEQHDLQTLWKVIEPKLDPICKRAKLPQLPLEERQGINAYMQQLNDNDPKGVSFRYGRERDMSRTIGEGVVRINIRSFAVCMEKLSRYLDGLNGWLEDMATDARNADCV
jgi:hypothetical protein